VVYDITCILLQLCIYCHNCQLNCTLTHRHVPLNAVLLSCLLLQDNETALHAVCTQVAASFETMASTAAAGQQPLLQRAALHSLSILYQVITLLFLALKLVAFKSSKRHCCFDKLSLHEIAISVLCGAGLALTLLRTAMHESLCECFCVHNSCEASLKKP
jgi:hypothetical protein